MFDVSLCGDHLTWHAPARFCRPEFLREVEKREEEEEVVESIEIREDRTLTKQLRQVRRL